MRFKYKTPELWKRIFVLIPTRCEECNDKLWLEPMWKKTWLGMSGYYFSEIYCNGCKEKKS